MISCTVHFLFCSISACMKEKYWGLNVTQKMNAEDEPAPIWRLVQGEVRRDISDWTAHLLLIPVNFSAGIIPPLCYGPLEGKTCFVSPIDFKYRQREKLQGESEIYCCSPWQQPQKKDISKTSSSYGEFTSSCLRTKVIHNVETWCEKMVRIYLFLNTWACMS